MIELALGHEPQFLPGERFNYSNTNYCILEAIIENVTGRSLASELSDRVFAPAGMESINEPYLHLERDRFAVCAMNGTFFGYPEYRHVRDAFSDRLKEVVYS